MFAPVEAEPADVLLDRVDVLNVFFDRIGVVEAQVAAAAVLERHAEIEADGFGVADVNACWVRYWSLLFFCRSYGFPLLPVGYADIGAESKG